MSLSRWTCPQCDETQLAPRRARKNDTRTYCLGCSSSTGRLVRRVCVVVERRREERAAARVVERTEARTQAQAEAQAWPNSLMEEWSRMLQLPTAREYLRGVRPKLEILPHRPVRRLGTSYGGRVTVRVGGYGPDSVTPRATMLHELAHEMLRGRFGRSRPDGRVHGDYFHAALKAITEEYTGIPVVRLNGTRRVEDVAVEQITLAAQAVSMFFHLAAQEANDGVAETPSHRAAEAQESDV